MLALVLLSANAESDGVDDRDEEQEQIMNPVKGVTGGKESIRELVLAVANESLAILDDLQPVVRRTGASQADRDVVERLRALIRSQLTELTGEMSVASGPRTLRVEQIFTSLLDQLASLQDLLGDEEHHGDFPALAGHVASLYRSWNNMQQILDLQMSIVTKQLGLVLEAVEEVRFAMNSGSAGPAERQIAMVRFDVPGFGPEVREQPPMSVENLLTWVHTFASEGGPRAMAEDRGFALKTRVAPAALELAELLRAAVDDANPAGIPASLLTPQADRAIHVVASRLDEVAWNC